MIQRALEELYSDQDLILSSDPFVHTPNRRGPRRTSASLLARSFLELCERAAIRFSIEIGAHEASFSQGVRRRLPSCRVVALEANPHVHKKFRHLCHQGLDYRHLAATSFVGKTSLHIPRRNNDATIAPANAISSIRSRKGSQFAYDVVEVPCSSIDALGFHVGEGGAMWIDVEGGQHEVLAGARRTLEAIDVLYIEIEDVQVWQDQRIASDIHSDLTQKGFVRVMRDAESSIQRNYVYIKPERAAHSAEHVAAHYLSMIKRLVEHPELAPEEIAGLCEPLE